MPARVVFLTDGKPRKIRFGGQTIELRRAMPRMMAAAGRTTGLVIAGLRFIGRANVSMERVAHLRALLSPRTDAGCSRTSLWRRRGCARILRAVAEGGAESDEVAATLPAEERTLYWRSCSERTGVPSFIVEKDFWVCWLLGRIFAAPRLGADCVFKGGTSLSKVFGAISRFSEDIDLGLSPASLGWKEADLDEARRPSSAESASSSLRPTARRRQNRFLPELEKAVASP